VVQAIEAFAKGAVVTFSQPLLQVDAGEPIGLAKGYVHWEFFAPSGAEGGIAKLLEQAGDWKSLFKRVKELSEDNFLELPDTPNGSGKNEIKPILVDTLPDDERQLVDGLMDSHRYETALTNLFQQAHSFAKPGDDKAKTQEPFTYPIKLSLKNSHAYKGPKPSGKSKLDVSFTRTAKVNGKDTSIPVGKKGSIEVADFNQLEFVIQVPALADTIQLSSSDFFLDRIPLTGEEHIKSRVALLETLTPYRWRHLLLEHVNEWTPSGLALLLDELEKFEVLQHLFPDVQAEQERLLAAGAITTREAPRDAVRTMLKPLAWWARTATDADPFGEVPLYGPKNAEESLFGTKPTQLPPDAKIDNLHPVTAAWLLDLLADAKKISFRERWPAPPLTRSETNDTPPYCSFAFASEPPKVGDQGFAVLVQHGYGDGDEATFKLKPGGPGTPISLPCASKAGVFKQPLLYSFWGTWQLEALDDKGSALAPRATPTVQLVTEKPVPADASLPTAAATIQKDRKSVQVYRATAKLSDHCPSALAGYVYFRCWKTSGAAPDFSSAPEIGKAAIPVVARKVTLTVKDVELVDGFVKNAKAAGTRVTESFSWGELHQASVFQGALADFRIDYQLCQRLQLLRTKSGRKIKVTQIQASGLEMTLKPQSGTKADFKLIVKALEKLPEAPGFSDSNDEENLTIGLNYIRPEQEPGELQLEFDPKAVLARVVGQSSAAAGDTVFIKPSFIAPNGGHYLLGGAQPGPGENDPEFDLDGLRAACDSLEFHSDLKIGPFKKLGMGAIRIRMTAGAVATDVALHGDLNQWKAAAPKIKLEGPGQPVLDGKLNGACLTATWSLFPNGQPNARWGEDLTFSVQIAHPEKLETTPAPPSPAPFTASPQLEELIADDSVQGKVRLVGQAHAVPTDRDLTILCEKQDESGGWVPDDSTTKAIKYQKPGSKGCGLCDESGQFVATFDVKCCSDGRKRRFTWKRVAQEGKIGGLSPGSASVEYPA
jgi:hypothetical protein